MSYYPRDFGIEIARGNIRKYQAFRKFGYNSAIGTTEEYIGADGGALPLMPTSAVTVEAISSSANDTAAGSGARTIRIFGLDANFNEITEDITLNGTSASTATTQSFIRVFRGHVLTTGTYSSANAGNITIRQSGAGSTFVTINTSKGQTEGTHYCVPAGKSLYIRDIHISIDSAKEVDIYFYKRQDADIVSAPFSSKRLIQEYTGLISSIDFEFSPEQKVPAKTDIWFSGSVDVSSGAASIEYNGILIEE